MFELSDRNLVMRTRGGETEAYGDLVRQYQNSVFNVCYRLLGERASAEDLAQDTFIRAYQRLGTFDDTRPFGPWVRRIAANLCLNHLKSTKSQPHFEFDEARDAVARDAVGRDAAARDANRNQRTTEPEKALISSERRDRVRAALLELPAHYRAAIELRHFQELTYDEMAAALEMPLNTVKSHLFRARKMLAEKLQGIEP